MQQREPIAPLSVYKLWYIALAYSHRSKWSRWTPAVEDAFGDAVGLSFKKWWLASKHLFTPEVPPFFYEVIETQEDFDFWQHKMRDPKNPDETLIIGINMLNRKDDLIAAIEKLLRDRLPAQRGRPAIEDWAQFPIAYHVTNEEAIRRALRVFKRRHIKKISEPNWVTATMLEINIRKGDPDPDVVDRRVLSATISRYLAYGERIVAGVAEGVFPAK